MLGVVEPTRYPAMPDIPAHRRDRPRLRDVVLARLLRPGRHAGADHCAAQRGDRRILTTDAVKARLATLGLAVAPSTPAELAAIIKEGLAVRGQLIKAANIQPEWRHRLARRCATSETPQ